MTSTVSGGGFSFSLNSISGAWKWTVSAANLQGPGPLYQVQDISTPYGPLTVVAVPLPADVVQAMAQSIVDVQEQVKPRMTLVSPKTSFSVGITEGDPRRSVGSAQVRNDGGFGSFLSAVATPDVPWLTVLVPEITGLARGDVASFSFDLVSDNLLATQSPFVGHIRIQDASDSSSFILVTVTVLVLPRPAIGVSTQNVSFVWSVSVPSLVSQTIMVTNNGPGTSNLSFSTMKLTHAPWLAVSPESGGPLPAGNSAPVTLAIVGHSVPPELGDHVETVRVYSQNASNSPIDVRVVVSVIL